MLSKKARILKKYPPQQSSKGYWYVNIRFAPGNEGRKTLKKNIKEDLEEAICVFVGENGLDSEFKRKNYKNYIYKKVFENWIKAQQYKNKNTENSNLRAYKRIFEKLEVGKAFAIMDIRRIKAADIENLMTNAIKEYNLSSRKGLEYYNMFFKSVYRQAIADGLIKPDKNPCLFVLQNRFLQFGRSECNTPNEERTIDDKTMKLLMEAARKDHERKADYMPPFAFELAALTGMRCGELGGLMWKNIDLENGVIHIVQSQKFDEATRTYYIADTKNRKHRDFPITDDIRDVLNRIKEVQEEYGKTGDYVFSNAKGFSSNRQIGDYLQNKKIQLKLDRPISIHAERRTLNSRMAAQGVSETVRANLLGHSPRVNQHNYTYDILSIGEKRDIIAKAGSVV